MTHEQLVGVRGSRRVTSRPDLVRIVADDHVELHYLGEDVREDDDPSDHRPARAAEFRERPDDWREPVDAIPGDNPDYEPRGDRGRFDRPLEARASYKRGRSPEYNSGVPGTYVGFRR